MRRKSLLVMMLVVLMSLMLLATGCQQPRPTPSNFTLDGVTYTYDGTENGSSWFVGGGKRISCSVLDTKGILVCRIAMDGEQYLMNYQESVVTLRDEIKNITLTAQVNKQGNVTGLVTTALEGITSHDVDVVIFSLKLIRAVDLTVLPALSAEPVNGWLLAIGIILILAGLITAVFPGLIWALLEARGSWRQPGRRSLLMVRCAGALAIILGIILIILAK